MDFLNNKDILNYLPKILQSDPKSLELFLNRADLIHSTISNDESSKAFFLNGIKSCTQGNDKLAICHLETYDLVKSVLISRIIPKKTVLERFQDLFNINQNPQESILNYSDRIRRAMYDLNVTYKLRYKEDSSQNLDLFHSMNMRNSLDVFVIGIFNQNLRSLVIGKDFTNLEEAILYAEEKELQLNIKTFSNQEQSVSSQTLNSVNESQIKKASNNFPINFPINRPVFKCGLCFRKGHQSKYCRFIGKSQSVTDLSVNKNIIKPIYNCEICFRKGHISPFCRYVNKPQINKIHQSDVLNQESIISPTYESENLPLIDYIPFIPPLYNFDNTFTQQSYLQPRANLNLPVNPYRLDQNLHHNYLSSAKPTGPSQFREHTRRSGV